MRVHGENDSPTPIYLPGLLGDWTPVSSFIPASAHNEARVPAEDAEGRKKLAGTMLRAPMSLEKMTYDAATGSVIYRSNAPSTEV